MMLQLESFSIEPTAAMRVMLLLLLVAAAEAAAANRQVRLRTTGKVEGNYNEPKEAAAWATAP
jgi:hypothetical protein